MKRNRLGRTGIVVTDICMGTMTFGLQADEKTSFAIMDRALEAGIDFFDTAELYPVPPSAELFGVTEQIVGKWLKGQTRGEIIIASKVTGPGHGWFRPPVRNGFTALDRRQIFQACEDSLRRLQTDYIDLYQIHASDTITPIEETLRALDTLVSQGKVRYIGCSNWYAWQLMKALGLSEAKNLAKMCTIQSFYSLAGRDLEREIVPLLKDQGTGLLVWSPLAGGLLSGKFSRENQTPEESRRSTFDFPIVDKERAWRILDVLRPVAAAHDTGVATVALAWVLAKPFVTSVIIGAKRPDQLQQNLDSVNLRLSAEEIARLDEASALPPEYPGWMIPRQNATRLG